MGREKIHPKAPAPTPPDQRPEKLPEPPTVPASSAEKVRRVYKNEITGGITVEPLKVGPSCTLLEELLATIVAVR